MRLLQIISEYFPPVQDSCGGTQVHLQDLTRALVARGHDISIFSALRGDEFNEYLMTEIQWEGIPVMRVTYNFEDVQRFEVIYASPKIEARFRAYLHGQRPDLVHVHHVTRLSTTLIEVCIEMGIPVVLTLHDYWMMCLRGKRFHPLDNKVCEELDRDVCVKCLNPLWPTLLPLEEDVSSSDPLERKQGFYRLMRWERQSRDVINQCDLVIAPSPFHRERFVEWGVDDERCVVVEHGLDTQALRAEPRGPRPVKTIGYVGNVIPPKGVHVLVEAFNLLQRPDLVLEIRGQHEVHHGASGYIDQLKAAPGLTVNLGGPYDHDRLPEILAGFDILVVPAIWWETFGLTVREAALAGVPVVASDLAGLHDAVAAGMALGFEPGNAEALAEVLRRLIEDDELRLAMGRKAHLVRDIADCAAETEQHYLRVHERAGIGS